MASSAAPSSIRNGVIERAIDYSWRYTLWIVVSATALHSVVSLWFAAFRVRPMTLIV